MRHSNQQEIVLIKLYIDFECIISLIMFSQVQKRSEYKNTAYSITKGQLLAILKFLSLFLVCLISLLYFKNACFNFSLIALNDKTIYLNYFANFLKQFCLSYKTKKSLKFKLTFNFETELEVYKSRIRYKQHYHLSLLYLLDTVVHRSLRNEKRLS